MGRYAEQAVNNHKNWYSCSSSVLCAFASEAGLSEREARDIASPYASGRQGKCGAVMSAEYVLKQKYGSDAERMIREFEKRFVGTGKRSVMCRDLMGSCRSCVRDASIVLEGMLEH